MFPVSKDNLPTKEDMEGKGLEELCQKVVDHLKKDINVKQWEEYLKPGKVDRHNKQF